MTDLGFDVNTSWSLSITEEDVLNSIASLAIVSTETVVEELLPKENDAKKAKGRFLRGPVYWDWLSTAARLPGRALHVATALAYLDGFERKGTVKLRPGVCRELGIDRYAASRGLKELEAAALVSVTRKRGVAPVVTLLGSRDLLV